MRSKIVTLLSIMCIMLVSTNNYAQHKIEFSYDNSGNMISRKVITLSSSQQPTNAPENNTSNPSSETETEKNSNHKEVFEDIIGKQDIRIFPNPTHGKLVVEIPNYRNNSKDRIDIYDLQGTLRMQISPISSSNTIYMHSYSAGTYILLIHVNGESVQWKIIKQ